MVDCPCGYGKNINEKNCPICGTDLTLLHSLNNLPNFYYKEGINLFKKGELDSAIEKLITAVSLNSKSAESYIALGKIYIKKGFYNEAKTYFEKALNIDPENQEIKEALKMVKESLSKMHIKEDAKIRNISILKKLLIGLPIATFLFGLIFYPLAVNLLKHKEPSLSKITLVIKDKISDLPELTGLDIEVTHNNKNIIIKGQVQNITQKNLILETVNDFSNNRKVDFQDLKISPRLYTVIQGDNLSKIARILFNNEEAWHKIYEANKDKINSPHRIFVGQVLVIPEWTENLELK